MKMTKKRMTNTPTQALVTDKIRITSNLAAIRQQ